MSDRQTKVTLALQYQQYVGGMKKAAQSTKETKSEAQQLAEQLEKQRRAFTLLGTTMVASGAVIAAGLAVVVGKFAEFDQAMSQVEAATHESVENMDQLREAALEAGASTVFSATEAANAIEELGKAGLATQDILQGGLAGALDLAAASGIGVAQAAEIAAKTMNQFALKGTETQHVADLLAAGAGKASGDVTDLGMALAQVGQVAHGTGLTVEETTTALAAFASQGLLGSDAGTSFKTMLGALTPNSAKAREEMERLGISAFNAAGQFVGLEQFAGNLRSSMISLTDEQRQASLEIIFGSDAVRAATALYNEGAEGIADWTEKVNDAGYASETASMRLDNLKGDWEALSGAVDTAMISMGEAANGPLRFIVQAITGLVDKFNDMPAGGQQAVFWIGAVGAAALTAYGSYLLLIPKISEYNEALAAMGPNAQRAGRALAAIGKGVGITAAVATAVTVAADALIAYSREVRKTDEAVAKATTTNIGFLDSLDQLGVTTDATADGVKRALDALASGEIFGAVGFDILTLRDGLTELDKGMTELPIDDAASRFRKWASELGLSRTEMRTMLDEMPGLKEAIRDHLQASGQAADTQAILNYVLKGAEKPATNAADAYADAAAEADALEQELHDLIDAMKEANGLGQDAVSTNAAYQAALAGISKEVEAQKKQYEEANGTLDGFAFSLDQSTEAGSANAAMLADVAAKAQDAAYAQYQVDLTTMSAEDATAKYAQTLADQKKAFEDSAVAAGANADEVHNLSDQVFALPDEKSIEILASTAQAANAIDEFVRTYNGKVITLQLTTNQVQVNGRVFGGLRDGRASGGAIVGPGGPTDDRAGTFDLSNGEHVLTAADVDAMGGQHNVYAFRESLHSGGGGGAGGDRVQVNQTINPAQGMSEEQIGRIAAEKINFALRR